MDFPDSPSLSLSLSLSLSSSSLLVGLLDNILCPLRPILGKFLLVGQLWHVCVQGSIE